MTTQISATDSFQEKEVLLEARNLKKYFPVTKGLLFSKVTGYVQAVDGVSFKLHK